MKMSKGYEPRWDIEIGFGDEGETRVADLLGLTGKTVEVKHDRHTYSPNLFIETHQKRGSTWFPSGVKASNADYWVYVMGETFTVIPTGVLKLAVEMFSDECDAVFIEYDTPTRGVLIPRVLIQQVERS